MEAEAGRVGYPEGQRLDVELSWKKGTWIIGLGEVEKAAVSVCENVGSPF